jgi:hypothetical protein
MRARHGTRGFAALHDVYARAAMDMQIDETGQYQQFVFVVIGPAVICTAVVRGYPPHALIEFDGAAFPTCRSQYPAMQ